MIPGFFTSAEESLEKLSPYYLPDLKLPGITPKCLNDVQLMQKRVMPEWAKISKIQLDDNFRPLLK